MSQLEIVQLPDLCLKCIFDFFDLRNLARCREVCRLFKFYADQADVHELAVDETEYASYDLEWHWTGLPVNPENYVRWYELSAPEPPQLRLHQQLKSLCIHQRFDFDLDLVLLNNFKGLIHLDIKSDLFTSEGGKNRLVLPNLRTLSLHDTTCDGLDPRWATDILVLSTPRLAVLQTNSIEFLHLEHPETVRELESDYKNKIKMAKFTNLEVFKCDIDESLNRELLSVLKNLKKLVLVFMGLAGVRDDHAAYKSALDHLLHQRTLLEMNELKIYWNRVLICNANQLVGLYSVKEYKED